MGIASAPDPPKNIPGTVLVDVDENTKTRTSLGCTITPCHAGPQKGKKETDFDIGPQRPLSPPKPDPQGVPGSACARAVVAAAGGTGTRSARTRAWSSSVARPAGT